MVPSGSHTQDADLYVDNNTASVLTEPAPRGSDVAQTEVRIDVPDDGCCHNFVQAGLVVYGSDDAFVKLCERLDLGDPADRVRQGVALGPASGSRATGTPCGPPG